jgi:hypothetical protein
MKGPTEWPQPATSAAQAVETAPTAVLLRRHCRQGEDSLQNSNKPGNKPNRTNTRKIIPVEAAFA